MPGTGLSAMCTAATATATWGLLSWCSEMHGTARQTPLPFSVPVPTQCGCHSLGRTLGWDDAAAACLIISLFTAKFLGMKHCRSELTNKQTNTWSVLAGVEVCVSVHTLYCLSVCLSVEALQAGLGWDGLFLLVWSWCLVQVLYYGTNSQNKHVVGLSSATYY